VITLFVFSDLVDGNMARQLGRSSRWGAFLDSTLDRVADGAIFGGFALWYAGGGDDIALCAVSIFCLASGQVVSYTKARGESIGLPVAVNGLVERAERLVISLVAAGLAGLHKFGVPGIQYLLPVALWIVAVGSLVTLIQRVVTVRRESAEAEAAAEPGAVEPGAAESAAAGRDGVGSDGAGSGDAESAAVEEKQKSQEQGSEAAK
jgi:CDP-diacylglycerol---glycerol-3-phosphate 3-phosphatidyltransferase